MFAFVAEESDEDASKSCAAEVGAVSNVKEEGSADAAHKVSRRSFPSQVQFLPKPNPPPAQIYLDEDYEPVKMRPPQ